MSSNISPEPIFTVPWFTLDGAHLTINVTDTEVAVKPPEEVSFTENGGKKWYKKQPLNSRSSQHWRETIGNEIVHKFLLTDRFNTTKYVLTDFPGGYALYTHKKANRPYDDPRADSYLFGGGHKFRSPNEVLYHLAWLMKGKPPNRCRCVYDNPDKSLRRKQGKLNTALKEDWRAFCDAQSKRRYQAFQSGIPYPPSTPTVNVFNEEMFLLPEE